MKAQAKSRKLQKKQAAWEVFMKTGQETKVSQRQKSGGYRRPGSWKNKS